MGYAIAFMGTGSKPPLNIGIANYKLYSPIEVIDARLHNESER